MGLDPALRPELVPGLPAQAEVDGVVAVKVTQLAATDGEPDLADRIVGAALLRIRGADPCRALGGNQRRYMRDTIRRVSFIRAAQQLGISLDEIRSARRSPCWNA